MFSYDCKKHSKGVLNKPINFRSSIFTLFTLTREGRITKIRHETNCKIDRNLTNTMWIKKRDSIL